MTTLYVPNKFPTQSSNRRIAIIGEAPGKDEVYLHQPFVGYSGQLLTKLLARAQISRDSVFVGNICQAQPPGNHITSFAWNGPEIQHGLQQLAEDLDRFNPNVCVLLGNTPLKAAFDCLSPTHIAKQKISNWRGSVFQSDAVQSPFTGRKCLPSYHPAACQRDYDLAPFLQLDLKKAVNEGLYPEARRKPRKTYIPSTINEALDWMRMLQLDKKKTAFDIEGVWNRLSCIGFSNHAESAYVMPFLRTNNYPYWPNPEDALKLWMAVACFLEDSTIPKIAQAGLYDRFCLHYGCGIRVHNVPDDTMTKHWAIYSELAKDVDRKKGKKGMGLAIQASIYTDIPYYKDDRKSDDDTTFYEYCGLDCMATKEINETIEGIFRFTGPGSFTRGELDTMEAQYRFNMEITNIFLYMELKGIRYNKKAAQLRRAQLRDALYETQARLNAMVGMGFSFQSKEIILTKIRELMLTKDGSRPYKKYIDAYREVYALLNKPNPSLATIGELENLCEVGINTGSPQFSSLLYDSLKLPVQYAENEEGEKVPTADYEALIKLSKICQQEDCYANALPILQAAIVIRSLSTRQRMLSISDDEDGRIRCAYNVTGSNTGRITCYQSPTGSGYNLQTIPNYNEITEAPGGVLGDRDLFLADPDWWFFQCDLAGADGWTVAAYSAMLGDDTMLLDYLAGLRPFEILVLELMGIKVPKDRQDIRGECKRVVKKDSWERFAMKRVQHGKAYLEGDLTVSRNILKDSEGKLYIPPNECGKLGKCFMGRYWGIPKWHDWLGNRMRARPVLQAASGQVRLFFGRADEIMTKAVAFEPQANTTYATNKAAHRLWTDPENNPSFAVEGTVYKDLRIQPLHQVHDALCGQFHKSDTAWATAKIKSYFNNTLTIAGQKLVIPYDGGYGDNWQQLNAGKL